MFVLSGSGWTEIDGQRVHWRPWDTVHLPAWAWHRHGNDSETEARFVTWSVQPMHESLGMAMLEDAYEVLKDDEPDEEPRPQRHPPHRRPERGPQAGGAPRRPAGGVHRPSRRRAPGGCSPRPPACG